MKAEKSKLDYIVVAIKLAMGESRYDKSWDILWWGRCSKIAKQLLGVFENEEKEAVDCVNDLTKLYKEKLRMSHWVPELYSKHAYQWRHRNFKKEQSKDFMTLGAIMRQVLKKMDKEAT